MGLLSLIGGGSENSSKDGNSGDGSSGSGGSTNRPINILLSKMTIAEEQAKGTEIGTLAIESGTKPYTYELVAGTGSDDNADFSIEGNRLKSNKIFDFETKISYSIRIQSTDKNKQTFAKAFTITISDIDENIPPTITKWTAGWRNNKARTATITGNQIKVDVSSADFLTEVILTPESATISPDPNTITDWSNEVIFTTKNAKNTKTYEVKVTVNGKDIITVTNANIATTVYAEIRKLGNTENFNHIDVGEVTNMLNLFKDKTTFNGDISKWDVSKVTNMSFLFYDARAFNQDIGSWNVSKVTNMNRMFDIASAFNQNIGSWNVSKVTDMSNMFMNARAFNQDIGSWNVSKVTDMNGMFRGARAFNQNIGSWNVSKVTNMNAMFFGAIVFNQDIGSWDVSKVTDIEDMFFSARAFNQNIGSWDVSKVTNMQSTFDTAIAFNQDISSWNVSKVTDMQAMFRDAIKFNQNIRNWNVSRVVACFSFSRGADAFLTADKPNFTACTP